MRRDMRVGDRYEQQLVEMELINIVNSLADYLNDPLNSNKTIPEYQGNRPDIHTTSEYNRLLLERERLSRSMTADNPALVRLNEQVGGLRNNIHASINSVLQGLKIQRRDARNQVNMYGGRVSSVPTREREFMELSREQHIKSRLFITLLQKREENALAMEATANSARVLDEAMVEGKVSPRTYIILLVALLVGFLVPAAIMYLIDMLQYRLKAARM